MTSLKKCMRKICATSLAVLMFGGSAVTVLPEVAQSGILASALSEGITDDGLVWKENDSGGVTITDYTGNGGNVVIPNEIDGKAVTKIGYGAFGYCTELTGISIPNSVTLIDYGAFYGCTGLTGINMPDSVVSLGRRVFYGCTGLTSVKMSNSITSIEVGVFNGCTKLTDIEIPDNVTLIEESAFCNCTGLKSVTIPKNVKSIGNIAFHGCKALESVTIPDGVTYIGYSAFRGCDELKSVTIPKSVISMGGFEFYACDKLTNIDVDILNPSFSSKDGVLFSKEKEYLRQCPAGKEGSYTIPDSVQQIEEGAFGYCDKLTSIIIPNNRFPVTILSGAFYRCSGLTNITIPNSVVTIGNQAFEYCTGLNSVNIPYSVTNIGERPFAACTSMTSISVDEDNTAYSSQNGVLLNKDKTKLIQYPAGKPDKKYEIGSSVTEIGEGAFKDCTNLESITIPDSVTKIGDSAFEGCNSISIVGKYGTAAEEYARNNNLTFVDVDNPLGYVTGIELDQTSLTLKKGESQKLKVTIIPYNAKDKTVKWSTDNESVAIVDDGTVTAVGKGTATITAESSNGKIAKCKVNVITVEAICIELSDKNLSIEKGKTETLTATIEPDDTTDKTVTWSTDNAEVATVNDGVVTAVDVGIANITARTANGKIATCKVTVFTIDPTNIQLNKTNITITKGKTRTLTATITPDNVTDDTITWTTDNDEVATVSNGSIHGVENGTATITATTSNGISASCKVTVIPFEWEENDDGGVTITDCYYKDYDLIIPSEIDGKPVTRISESLLMWDEVCTVMIPASVTQIEDGFLSTTTYHRKWSSNLWPSIGILGYSGTAAEKLAEEKGLRFADLNKENYNDVIDFECDGGKIVFYVGEGGDVDIPVQIFGSKITEIGESAFGKKPGYFQRPEIDYSKLTSVQIHENITKIGAYAFSKCTGLTNITIPSSVTQIGMFPFAYCSNLENIEVDNSNQNYSSYGGVLFDKNKTRLIVCPEGKKGDFVIPDGVETIEGEAFADCSEITSVTIPDSVTSIGSGAFNNCTKLTTIYGYLNSAAETYATENDLTFVPLDEKPSIPAVSIKINKTSLSLEKGKTEKLTATITPDNATDKSITWTSDDEKVATVSDDGTVKAVSAGVATVTAKTNNGKTATCKVTVKNPVIAVTSVKLNKTAVTIEKGKTETLTATITPDNATDKTVTWTTDNNKVATVANGKITAVSAGIATITAKTNNGKTATCKVTVKNSVVAVTSVKLNKTAVTIEKGKTETLTATITPDNATDKTVTWTTDNNKVATVANGKITAVSAGVATITAKTNNGKTATCKVTVKNPVIAVTSIKLNKTAVTIEKGKTETLTATITPDNATDKTVTWTTDNNKVATVANGKITAVSAGVATITAKTNNGKTATCKVTVKNPIVAVTSVKLNKTSISLEKGKTEKLTATIYPDNVTDKNVTWTSDNGKVATVSDDGTVKAISTGTATITATASNGISASCKVTVIPFKWEENANGGVTITGYTGEDGDVVIPLEIDGIAVTEIGDEAFRGCAGLTSITIPESVTEISGDTFSGCDNLVIYGYKNSYAESYAKKCSIPFVAVGNKLSDTETNITVTGDIGENTKLEVSELKPGDVKISGKKACAYYDISLTENGVKVQPNGNVVVKIPYKDGGENIEVYRINDDGSTEKMRSSYDGEYVTFITDHFSKYAIVADAGIKGDTNNDGEVNIADALMISRYDAGMAELEKSQLALSNVNGDGEVNIADALMISRFDAGLIDSL